MGSLSCVPSIFPLPFSPKRLPASSSQAAYRSFHRKRQNSLAPLLLLSPQSHAALRGTPTMAACFGVGTLPGLRDILSRSGSLRCFPCRGIPFRTVILFSRCSSSMNYLKCILFDRLCRISIRSEISPENKRFPRSRNCGKIKIVER